jgi:hypothetical protein
MSHESRFGKMFKGNTINQFLIDCFASGLPTDYIVSRCKENWNYEPTEDELIKKSQELRNEIIKREDELLEEIRKTDLSSMVLGIIYDLKEKSDTARNTKELVELLMALNKYLEFFMKKQKAGSEKTTIQTQNIYMQQQNNYNALEYLEKKGFITITKKKEIKKMLNISDEDEQRSES